MKFDDITEDFFCFSVPARSENSSRNNEVESGEERRDRLENLRRQIRAGTYRPSIGDIAISLVRGGFSSGKD